MEFFLTLSNSWQIIYNGMIKTMLEFFEFSIPEFIALIFIDTPLYDTVYMGVYDILSIFPIGTLTLADISFFSMMFGVGIGFVIAYSIIKWLAPQILD